MKLQKGKWYFAAYGFETVTGRCLMVTEYGAALSFRWGGPFRTTQFVGRDTIIGEAPDPRWFGLIAWLKGLTDG